jgi:RNA polymerase sigma-32 factor
MDYIMTTDLTINFPVAAQSLESYIQAVNRYPLLSAEEEQQLGHRWKEQQDLDAARQLVLSHLRLVVSVARHYLGYGLPQADLIQEGNIGLMKAVKRFDPDRGVRLVSFALHWIKAEIHEYILRNWRLVKVATTKAQRKLFFNLRSMRQGLGTLSAAETDSIARDLGVKPEEVREMETRMSGQDIGLDPTVDDGEESFSPIAYLASPEESPVEVLVNEQTERLQHEGLATALDSLDERSRRIIESRWLNNEEPATLHELAAEYGVSAERIRQIEAKAMQKMRALIPA